MVVVPRQLMANSIADQFDKLCSELERDGIIDRTTVTGCTEAEIQALADKYDLDLPESYQRFLSLMGHDAGRLTKYGEYDFDYTTVLNLTTDKRRFATDDGDRDALDHVVGPTDLIVLTRLGDYQLFIRCDGGPDSEVRYYFSDDFRNDIAYPSVLAMIDSIADECRRIKYW